jgi:hypothetical protein
MSILPVTAAEIRLAASVVVADEVRDVPDKVGDFSVVHFGLCEESLGCW